MTCPGCALCVERQVGPDAILDSPTLRWAEGRTLVEILGEDGLERATT